MKCHVPSGARTRRWAEASWTLPFLVGEKEVWHIPFRWLSSWANARLDVDWLTKNTTSAASAFGRQFSKARKMSQGVCGMQTCSILVITQGLNKGHLLAPFGKNLCNVPWCSLFEEICEDFSFGDPAGGWPGVLCQKQPLWLDLPRYNVCLWLFQTGSVHRVAS